MKQLHPSQLPYAGTGVSWYKTQAQISALLNKFGINDVIWNTVEGIPQLVFKTEVEIEEGKPRPLMVILKIPVFIERHKTWDEETRKHKTIEGPNLAQTGRIMLNILKGQLTAISGGVVKFEEIFLSDLAVPTPTGPKRFVEVLKEKNLLGEKGLVALPEQTEESGEVEARSYESGYGGRPE
jgi:hypothetical protein